MKRMLVTHKDIVLILGASIAMLVVGFIGRLLAGEIAFIFLSTFSTILTLTIIFLYISQITESEPGKPDRVSIFEKPR